MRKLLLIVMLLPLFAASQSLPGHTFVNQRYRWVAGVFNQGLNIPGTCGFPSFKTGTAYYIDGQVMADTCNNRFYFYSGGAWRLLSDSAGTATLAGLTNVGSGYRIYAPQTPGIKTLSSTNIALDTATSGQIGITGGFGVSGADSRATAARSFSAGAQSFNIDSAASWLVRARGGSMGTRTHLIQMTAAGIAQTRLRAQSSAHSSAFAQISVINTNEARPELTMTVVDTSLNGTSMTLKGDTMLFTIDGSSVGANVRYIMENMQPQDDTSGFQILGIDTASGDLFRMRTPWSGGGGGGSGDFVGPASSTDNAVVRFDGTTGKLGQNSVVLISDAGAITGIASMATANVTMAPYNSGATNDAMKISNNNVGATLGLRNSNGGGFTGIEFDKSDGTLALFEGYNNGVAGEFRYNLVASSGHFRWMISGTEATRIANNGAFSVGSSQDFTVTSAGKISDYANAAPSNGQILIGDGTDFEKATITAGTGINVANGAASITISVPSSFITQSTYTPTLTNTTNLSASVANANTVYTRVGDAVTVAGTITVTPTAELSDCVLGFSLPIASNFAATTEGGGAGAIISGTTNNSAVAINMDATNDRATFSFFAPADGSALTLTFTFTYRVTNP